MWIVEKIISKGDYDYAVVLEHPCALPIGHYVLAHRVVLENYLGRLLDDGEIAHHINGVKKDNRIENIELCLEAVHRRYHAKTGRTFITLICDFCGEEFKIEKRQSHKKSRFCCKECYWNSLKGKTFVTLICSFCGDEFKRESKQMHTKNKKYFCNKECYYKSKGQ